MLAETIAIGVGLPQTAPERALDPALVAAFAARAEALGFADLWTMDMALSSGPALDGVELLSYAAALTRTVRLGVAVLVLPRHDPRLLAVRMDTLDRLSGGRAIVGVGAGPAAPASGAGDAVPAVSRARALVDGLAEMRARWARPLPVWFGGSHADALRRAVRLGDGWIGGGAASGAAFARQARVVREALADAGRDPAGFAISKRVYVAVASDVARARRRVAAYFAAVYGSFTPAEAERVAVVGPPERCAEQLAELAGAGARHLVLHPLFDEAEQLEALAELTGVTRC